MIFILILTLLSAVDASKEQDWEKCSRMYCSNVIDYVCGMAKAWDGSVIISRYQNICQLTKIKCRIKDVADLTQVEDEKCHIDRKLFTNKARRINDFGIVGAHQACNHTCPTYCVDTYEPACAQIWQKNMKRFNYRPMINHCHIDLFSCAVGVNVTIHALSKCYKNPSGLLFMTQMAAMNSLGLLEDNDGRRRSFVTREEIEDNTRWQTERLLSALLKSTLSRRRFDYVL